jgi:hypothetical protein
VSRRWKLIEKKRKIHPTGAMVAFVSINGSNLRTDSAYNEVFKDSRHFWMMMNRRIVIAISSSPLSPIWNRERRGCFKIYFAFGFCEL